MLLDTQKGIMYLPNGFFVSPGLTPGHLLMAPVGAKPYHLSALPFRWFSAQGGIIEDTFLLTEFCFCNGLLVHVDLHMDLEQGQFLIEDEKIHAVAEQSKAMLNRLLERDLGVPHRVEQGRSQGGLDSSPIYRYTWGEIALLHHLNNTFIRVEFAGRRQEAQAAFVKTGAQENMAAVRQFKSRRF